MSARIIPFPIRVATDEPFGGCPECGGNDGYLNVGPNHWFFCEQHNAAWNPCSNMFSSWREQTEAVFAANAARLRGMAIVEPTYPSPGAA